MVDRYLPRRWVVVGSAWMCAFSSVRFAAAAEIAGVRFGANALAFIASAAADDAAAPSVPDALNERSLVVRKVVPATVYDVWWAWTTSEGLASFFAEGSTLDLKIGGAWELYMSVDAPVGSRGSEGCKLLTYVPYEMLCFEWTSPPSIPELRDAGILTRVMVEMKEIGVGYTEVTITHSGFGSGELWDRNDAYFEKAWPHVANNMEKTFAERGESLRQPAPNVAIKEWDDGPVLARSNDGDSRWQTFEIVLPAPVADVWSVLATSEGMKRFMGGRGEPEIELKAGGKYAIWPAARNRVMTFANERMLAVTGSAPDKFPDVQSGGTWAVYRLLPEGTNATRLRLCTMGWSDKNDEWKDACAYFEKANPQYLDMLFAHFGGKRVEASEGRTLRWICDLDVSSDEAWALFTTKAGIESWMVPVCEVDFRVGGTIKTNYDKAAGIGGPGTIEHHILSYEPGRMYSGRFIAPENAKAAKGVAEKTWGVTTFEPRGAGRTRIRLASCGWGRGDEWDKAEQFFTWGNRVTLQGLIRRAAEKSTNASGAEAETSAEASKATE